MRASIFGLERNHGPEYLARAALESVAYQTQDLLEAIKLDYPLDHFELNVDGGMSANNWLLQFLADISGSTIKRSVCIETSALGAAHLAGLQIGLFDSIDNIKRKKEIDKNFCQKMEKSDRDRLYQGWNEAIEKLLFTPTDKKC